MSKKGLTYCCRPIAYIYFNVSRWSTLIVSMPSLPKSCLFLKVGFLLPLTIAMSLWTQLCKFVLPTTNFKFLPLYFLCKARQVS